jgi:hypothetical protein
MGRRSGHVISFPVLNGLHHDYRSPLEADHALFTARMKGVASTGIGEWAKLYFLPVDGKMKPGVK